MKKSIWLSSLVSSKEKVQALMATLNRYGLEVDGHFWEDDLDKMAWIKPRERLIAPEIAMWGILGAEEDFKRESLRYGLSLLATTVQAKKGLSFPVVLLLTEGSLDPAELPTPLKGVDILSYTDAGLGAKLVAKVHSKAEALQPDYRLDIYGNSQIGQWFEVGPAAEPWEGALFGVIDGKITFQAVGPKGRLPSTSILNYPMQGLKITMGDTEYTAWAVKNEVNANSSYFAKVEGFPESILFGSYSEADEAEVFVVRLK